LPKGGYFICFFFSFQTKVRKISYTTPGFFLEKKPVL
jgi:hypothetical protein